MHEAQQPKEAIETQTIKKAQRPYKYYAFVTRHLVSGPQAQCFDFQTKSELREAMSHSDYDGAELRIIRGYEMNVKAKRQISIN